MKKIILCFNLCFITLLFSQEIHIEDVINDFSENSRFSQIQELDIEKFQIEKIGIIQNRNQKVSTDIELNHRYLTKSNDYISKNRLAEDLKLKLQYDDFYVDATFDFEKDTYDRSSLISRINDDYMREIRVGFQKPINDIFYSQEKYEKKYVVLKEEIVDFDTKYNFIVERTKIIDLYVEILDIQKEFLLDRSSQDEYKELMVVAKEKAKLGEAIELEVEYVQLELLEIENRLIYLEEKWKNKINELGELIGVEFIFPLFFQKIEENEIDEVLVNEYNLKKKLIEKKLEMENYKLLKRKDQTEFIIGTDYDIQNDIWSLRFNLKGDFFDIPIEKDQKKVDLKKVGIEISQLEDELKLLKENRTIEYNHFVKDLSFKKKKKENKDKTVDIMLKLYERGYITTKKLVEEKVDARTATVEYIRALNLLSGFQYKMKLLRKDQK